MTQRRHLTLLLALLCFGWSLTAGLMFAGDAVAAGPAQAQLTKTVPTPGNSSPWGGHVFFLRRTVNQGENTILSLEASYPSTISNSEWRNQNIELLPGGSLTAAASERICNTNAGTSMTPTEKDRFITVKLTAGGNSDKYYINVDNVCKQTNSRNDYVNTSTSGNNKLFAKYSLPSQPPRADTITDRFLVEIEISYNDSVPQLSREDGNGIRLTALADTPGAKIGALGGVGFAFPLITRWNEAQDPTELSIPFGLCGESRDGLKVGVYDSDNGSFGSDIVKFRVWDNDGGPTGDGDWVEIRENNRGSINNSGWFVPTIGEESNDSRSWFKINMLANHHYQLQIKEVSLRNTIVAEVPGHTLYGDPEVCTPTVDPKWKLNPNTEITQTVIDPGGTTQWNHTVQNTGQDLHRAGDSTYKVFQTVNGGTPTTVQTGPNVRLIKDQVWPLSKTFTATNADRGKRICQWISVDPFKEGLPTNNARASIPKCVYVNLVATTDRVTITAFVNRSADSETGTTANFSGGVRIGNYPQPTEGGWGYNQLATARTADRVAANYTPPSGTSDSSTRTVYTCPAGYSPTNPTTNTSTSCSAPGTTTYTCPATYTTSYPGGGTYPQCAKLAYDHRSPTKSGGVWSCPSGYFALSGSGSTQDCVKLIALYATPISSTTATAYSYPYSSTEYNYYCRQTNTWSGWSSSSGSPCNNYYTCPAGSPGSGWGRSSSEILCSRWQCNYPSASPGHTQDAAQTRATAQTCSYRCASGGGDKAYYDPNWDNTTGTGDLRCFVPPTFTVTCYWDNGQAPTSQVVNWPATGDYCQTTTTKPAGAIGSEVCARLTPGTPDYPSGWITNPMPGTVYNSNTHTTSMLKIWGWTATAATNCGNVVGMPYVMSYGGDVRVGGGIGSTPAAACAASATNSNAIIKTYNQGSGGGYAGSGAQHGVFATGFVDKFVSGQFNDFGTDPSVGSAPTRLTFAGNTGGSGYGGKFSTEAKGACVGYVSKLPTWTQELTGDQPTLTEAQLSTNPAAVNNKVTKHVANGDVFIASNITYGAGWATTANIPLYQLVVQGDIYISNYVHQLDGLYVALPRTDGAGGGHIYTCAFGIRNKPSTAFINGDPNCKSQLVVNGAFAAKQIHFLRDCSSLHNAYVGERTTTSVGGSNDQLCGATNHAAEVFNYTSEQWIRGSAGSGSNQYDSISSMPPVL